MTAPSNESAAARASAARWGGPLVTRPIGDESFRSHWLKLPFEMHLRDRTPEQPPIAIEVRTGDEPMLVETIEGVVRARPGRAEHPDAAITGTGSQVLGLLTGKLTLDEARRRGLTFEGSEEALRRVQPSQT